MCVRHHHCYFFNVHSENGSWRETEVFICPVCGEGTSSPLILCGEYLSSLPLTLYTRAFARRRSVLGRFSVFSYMGERGGGRRCEKKTSKGSNLRYLRELAFLLFPAHNCVAYLTYLPTTMVALCFVSTL
ncbi:uncharacterized protein TEOVI_000798400 [Trypanosoma equiperdum]|uniref:Uncharacterized protein n=2 Tax=Trypanozoon TaxID=39700 RepID=Q38DY8_TRYB2|nr:hypothetical protein, unlikely [Trypanosoma brucei brucei TREU927]EAN76982.1 hypothetical protein, unlikely [Trypanosoma brucei brucei TREU927]SCU68637.1 hypothetical protein, conserved [Trypanosoma equiperdum]